MMFKSRLSTLLHGDIGDETCVFPLRFGEFTISGTKFSRNSRCCWFNSVFKALFTVLSFEMLFFPHASQEWFDLLVVETLLSYLWPFLPQLLPQCGEDPDWDGVMLGEWYDVRWHKTGCLGEGSYVSWWQRVMVFEIQLAMGDGYLYMMVTRFYCRVTCFASMFCAHLWETLSDWVVFCSDILSWKIGTVNHCILRS